jgi:hypothetical protein
MRLVIFAVELVTAVESEATMRLWGRGMACALLPTVAGPAGIERLLVYGCCADAPATHDTLAQAENDEALLGEAPAPLFSGEEAMGRFLDLHEHHQAYLNSKFGKQARWRTCVWNGTASSRAAVGRRSHGYHACEPSLGLVNLSY